MWYMQAAELHHDQKQEEHSKQIGVQQVLCLLQGAHATQRDQVVIAGQ
jgi:hypothetical protein